MDEIVVDRRQVRALAEHVQQLLTHTHQQAGAARRKIETAKQFLTARLRRRMDAGGSFVDGLGLPRRDGFFHAGWVGAEALRQRLEEGDARADGQFAVTAENFASQSSARSLAAAGQQVLAEFDEAFRVGCGVDAPATIQQGAAAVGDRLEEFPEERGVHVTLFSQTHDVVRQPVGDTRREAQYHNGQNHKSNKR